MRREFCSSCNEEEMVNGAGVWECVNDKCNRFMLNWERNRYRGFTENMAAELMALRQQLIMNPRCSTTIFDQIMRDLITRIGLSTTDAVYAVHEAVILYMTERFDLRRSAVEEMLEIPWATVEEI